MRETGREPVSRRALPAVGPDAHTQALGGRGLTCESQPQTKGDRMGVPRSPPPNSALSLQGVMTFALQAFCPEALTCSGLVRRAFGEIGRP